MKVSASLKNLRIAPRKVRLVTHSVVGVDAREAVIQLGRQVKRSSGPIRTLLKSALANATNNFGLDEANLFVHAVRVGDGLRLKRWSPRAFGRAAPLLRRGSNVTLILEEKIEGQGRTAPRKPEEKPKTVEESELTEAVEGERPAVTAGRPELRKEPVKDLGKSATGKVVKKVFQRKSV